MRMSIIKFAARVRECDRISLLVHLSQPGIAAGWTPQLRSCGFLQIRKGRSNALKLASLYMLATAV